MVVNNFYTLKNVYICQLRQWHTYLILNDPEYLRGQYLSRQPTERIEIQIIILCMEMNFNSCGKHMLIDIYIHLCITICIHIQICIHMYEHTYIG